MKNINIIENNTMDYFFNSMNMFEEIVEALTSIRRS